MIDVRRFRTAFMRRQRAIVLCFATPDYAKKWNRCIESQRAYCVRNDFEFQCTSQCPPGLNPKWSKLKLALDQVRSGRDVMMIDADAEISAACPPFVEVLASYRDRDIFYVNGISERPNSGVMLFRGASSSAASKFLSACLAGKDVPVPSTDFVSADGENGHIIHFLKQPQFATLSRAMDRKWNTWHPDEFHRAYVRHSNILTLGTFGGATHTMLDAWRPIGDAPATLLRWTVTEWCNYRCPYCPQTHGRYEPKGNEMTAHAFDNFPIEQWMAAFDRHFAARRLSMVITGGEPMVDRRNMTKMINFLSDKSAVECIRIDTNAWWRPEQFSAMNHSKLTLMCTFHPSQTDEAVFVSRITSYMAAGYKIGMVNYVMTDDNVAMFADRRKRFSELGLVLHPNPLWQADSSYSDADLDLMRRALPPMDFGLRSKAENPHGRNCYFPSIGYEMDYTGTIFAGCMYDRPGSFFDDTLPDSPDAPVPCPHVACVCLDKYSFLEGCERNISTNPLAEYSKELLNIRAL